MRIAIIGAGNVGSALGRGWLGAAEDVVFGVPNPADPKYNPLPCERLLTPQEAARNTQTVVLATPWQATETAVKASAISRARSSSIAPIHSAWDRTVWSWCSVTIHRRASR